MKSSMAHKLDTKASMRGKNCSHSILPEVPEEVMGLPLTKTPCSVSPAQPVVAVVGADHRFLVKYYMK